MNGASRRGQLTVEQVAKVCSVSTHTVRQWIKRGHVTRNRYGRIQLDDVLVYLDRRGQYGQHRRAG